MRLATRVLTLGLTAALTVLPLALLEGASAGGAESHALTVPAQVVTSNWTVAPNAVVSPSSAQYAGQVSCVSSVFCMAVGNEVQYNSNEFSQIWNGATWSSLLTLPSVPSSTGTQLNDVSCVNVSFCIAVGSATVATKSVPVVEQWNGSAWTIVIDTGPSTGQQLSAVSCRSTSFCMAVGTAGTMSNAQYFTDQWNGSTWTTSTISLLSGETARLAADVTCVTQTACMLVGGFASTTTLGPVAQWWNGVQWTDTHIPQSASQSDVYDIDGVSCAGVSFCVAVGDDSNAIASYNLVDMWNGSSWTMATVPNPGSSGDDELHDVACFSPTSCTAVGTDVSSMVLTWNGQAWQTATSPSAAGFTNLTGVDCLTNWSCMATGFAESGSNFLPYDLTSPIARSGYRFVASDGGIFNYGPSSGGGAPFLGSMGGTTLNAPIVGMATMPAGDGYYLVASDGGIFNFGSAQFFGSMGGKPLNKPIVGMAVTPDGGGYWLVASDGGIFAFGDAPFYGSMGGQPLNKPIVGIAPTPNGNGYYEVASDGGIFTFPTNGGPPFLGSTGATVLNKPIVGMAVTASGQYYLVASDGGIFSFPEGPSGPPFYGSTGAITLNKPVIGMSIANGGAGYYLGASDGGIFSFPSGPAGPTFYGSRGGQPLNEPIVGISG